MNENKADGSTAKGKADGSTAKVSRLTRLMLEKASGRNAYGWLALVSFVEGFIFPVPPDVMVVPMVLARRERAWTIASIATVFTSLGGVVGWLIGYGFYATVGERLIDFFGYSEGFEQASSLIREYGAEVVVAGALTPIPYKLIAIASGLAELPLGLFFVYSLFGRSLRFFAVAALLYRFHRPMRRLVERYFGPMTLLLLAALIAGVAALRYFL